MIAAEREKRERVRDDDWDYLQLAAVWVRHLLKDDGLADALVNEIATGRPFSFGMFSGGSKHGWGGYGYPTVSLLSSDFRILYPRNVGHRLNDGVRQRVKHWDELLMDPDQLRDTYERIEKIREPIRQRLLKQLEEQRERRRPQKPDSKPGDDPGLSTDENPE